MTEYALVVMLESADRPRTILNELVSNLEFDHCTTIGYAVVLTRNGRNVAVYDRKEAAQC